MWNKCSQCCQKNAKPFCGYTIAFGLGMTVSCFCPFGLLMFVSALIITTLGIIVIRR